MTALTPIPVLPDEAGRLLELHHYQILFTEPELAFDRITQLAARLLQTPIAVLNFIGQDTQWFKSCIGLDFTQTARDVSLCTWAIAHDDVMVLPDARLDERFASNPFVTPEGGIRFYAGAPLITPRGFKLGTLCVIDTIPRPAGLTEDARQTLQDLAAMVASELELRLALKTTREAQAFTRSILEASPDCVKVITLDGHLLSMNEGGCRQMEIDDFSLCVNIPWLDFWDGPHRVNAEHALLQARAGRTETFQGFCRTAKGTPKWWEVIVTPVPDQQGKPFRILSVSRDITERKTAEEQLRTVNEKLAQASLELRRSNDDLERFAQVASHDLRSPLKTVVQFLELLAIQCGENLDESAKEYIHIASSSARRLEKLVQDLLLYSKVSAAPEATIVEVIDSRPPFDAAVANLAGLIRETNAVVTCGALPPAQLDALHLLQIFQNLVCNALCYRRAEAPRIHVSGCRDGGQSLFSISDNGMGIEARYCETIFQPFKRLHGLDVAGSGVGLSICKKIVERAGGRIWVESEVGVGSKFHVVLPSPGQLAS